MKICAITGSRADWGLLLPVLRLLRASPTCRLQLIATGSHLDTGFGGTLDQVHEDGFEPDERVPLDREGDDARAIARAMGRAIADVGAALTRLHPDLLLVLGDRYEIFAAVQAALLNRVPVAHIAGGDTSEGAYDDAIRHAITKLSHLHFTTNAEARRRVLQMGEAPARVFHSGSPGIDALLQTPRWTRERLQDRLGFALRPRNIVVTMHPATLDPATPEQQLAPLLQALGSLDDDTGIIVTGANADTGGSRFNATLHAFCATRSNACFTLSLGQAGYYSLVEACDLVVGNSSSGLYEAPALATPTLDIGIRQQGRARGPSVYHADNDPEVIATMLRRMLQAPPDDFTNPYGDGTASRRIVDELLRIEQPQALLIKHFVDRP